MLRPRSVVARGPRIRSAKTRKSAQRIFSRLRDGRGRPCRDASFPLDLRAKDRPRDFAINNGCRACSERSRRRSPRAVGTVGQYYAREKKTRRADFSIRYRVQGSPLPKEVRNPRWVPRQIPHSIFPDLLYSAHVRTQNLGYRHAAVLVLIVLQHCDQCPRQRQP